MWNLFRRKSLNKKILSKFYTQAKRQNKHLTPEQVSLKRYVSNLTPSQQTSLVLNSMAKASYNLSKGIY